MLADLVLYILVNGIVILIKKIPALTLTERPNILHKQLESHAVRCGLSAFLSNRPVCTRASAELKVIPLELRKIAVKYVPVVNNIGVIAL